MSAVNILENAPEAEMNLENQLKRSLRPVKPDPEFVGHLHNRLTTPVEMTIEQSQNTAFGLLLVAFSLMSGVFLIWLLRQFRSG
jgi:hypothetical protein